MSVEKGLSPAWAVIALMLSLPAGCVAFTLWLTGFGDWAFLAMAFAWLLAAAAALLWDSAA